VLAAIDAKQAVITADYVSHLPSYFPLSIVAPLLKRRFAEIQEAFSETNYAATMEKIQEIETARKEFNEQMRQRSRSRRANPEANPWNKKETIQSLGLKDPPE
jgi:hypothetical protein